MIGPHSKYDTGVWPQLTEHYAALRLVTADNDKKVVKDARKALLDAVKLRRSSARTIDTSLYLFDQVQQAPIDTKFLVSLGKCIEKNQKSLYANRLFDLAARGGVASALDLSEALFSKDIGDHVDVMLQLSGRALERMVNAGA